MSEAGSMDDLLSPDRISQLPDSICHHIISLLPRRFAIRTGVLSIRWWGLWKSHVSGFITLNFNEQFTVGMAPSQIEGEIDRIFAMYDKKKIDKFYFVFRGHLDRKKVGRWIMHAVSNGVEEFYFTFSKDGSCMPCQMDHGCRFKWGRTKKFMLKDELFVGNLLVVLSLDFCELEHNFSFTSFRSLEVIRLCGVLITDKMLSELLSNCQLLESVDLVECNMLRFIRVWQPRLKRLALTNCWQVEVLEILTPNLQSFHFHGMFPKKYHIGTHSLVDLIITSRIYDYSWRMVEASMSLEFVQVLTLCSRALQYVFGSTVAKSGLFRRLRELQLLMVQMTDDNMDDIYRLFRNYDFSHLEKLFIELPTTSGDSSLHQFIELRQNPPPDVKFEHLTTVKLNNYKSHKNEVMLVKYIFKSASVLKKMHLIMDADAIIEDHTPHFRPKIEMASRDAELIMVCGKDDSVSPKHKEVNCMV